MLRLVVAALILTAVFGLLERRYRGRVPVAPEAADDPAARRRFGLRRDTRTDLIYWLFTPLVTRTISLVGLFLAIILLAAVKGVELDRESGLGPLLAGSPIVAQARKEGTQPDHLVSLRLPMPCPIFSNTCSRSEPSLV